MPWRRVLRPLARRMLVWHVPVAGPMKVVFRACYRLHVVAREGLIWALRFFWYEPLFRSQCEAIGAGFWMEQLPYLTGRGQLVFGERVRLSGKPSIGFCNRICARPELVVGSDTFIGHGCGFSIARSVHIGNHCLLASGVGIRDYDGHPLDARRRRAGEFVDPQDIRPVVIGDDVWLGAGALILKGVTVGARSIVAAGAIVTRDVPADAVVAGNPARVVKHLDRDCSVV
jgi:acetyltransferase-like isoleucine patch superfamily enzyme